MTSFWLAGGLAGGLVVVVGVLFLFGRLIDIQQRTEGLLATIVDHLERLSDSAGHLRHLADHTFVERLDAVTRELGTITSRLEDIDRTLSGIASSVSDRRSAP